MDKARAARMEAELRCKVVLGWTVGRTLGFGKSALVFEATRASETAALKIFDPELIERFGADSQEERLRRELQLIGKNHPNLVKILDGGQEDIAGTSYWLIIMELVSGRNLKDAIPHLPEAQIRPVLKQLAEAARFLEQSGQCHRDIKPENIVITDDFTQAKLLDFGIIRPLGATGDDCTGPAFIGTLRYAPPEFLLRREKDSPEGWRAVTFYQLGGVLHDMLTKRLLFDEYSDPYANLANAVQHRAADHFPDEPSDLVQLAKSCLLKDPEARLRAVSWNDFIGEKTSDRIDDLKRAISRRKFEQLGASLHSNRTTLNERWKGQQVDQVVESVRHELQAEPETFPRFEIYPSKPAHGVHRFAVRFPPSSSHALIFHASFFFTVEFPSKEEPIIECFAAAAVANRQIDLATCDKMHLWFSGIFEAKATRSQLKEVLLQAWLAILNCKDCAEHPTIVWEGSAP